MSNRDRRKEREKEEGKREGKGERGKRRDERVHSKEERAEKLSGFINIGLDEACVFNGFA